MKAVVAAFNLLRDYEPSDGTFSSTNIYSASTYLILMNVPVKVRGPNNEKVNPRHGDNT